MGRFKTVRAAKDYLAGLIVDQAEREDAPLTEVERRMLYFTEEGGLSKEMAAVNQEFERDYEQNQYEERIGGLVSRLIARDEDGQLRQDWDAAVTKLARGDHYLLALLDSAPSRSSSWLKIPPRLQPWFPSMRPSNDPKDALHLIVCSFAILAGAAIVLVIVSAVKGWIGR